MKALTLWQPWARAITHHGKRIENREWRPPSHLIGKRLAIHAGKRWDDAYGRVRYELPNGDTVLRADCVQGAIVATVQLYAFATMEQDIAITLGDEQLCWWAGPGSVAWILRDVRVIEPIPCRGAQGLWNVPAEISEQLR